MTSDTASGSPEGQDRDDGWWRRPARPYSQEGYFPGQGWQRPGDGRAVTHDGYFPGQWWQPGTGMGGPRPVRYQGLQDGGQVTAGGFSAPTSASPFKDWREREAAAKSQPITRLDWSAAGGKPPPPETFSQWVKRVLRCWWADLGNAVEDRLIVWRDKLIGVARDLASRDGGDGGSGGMGQ